MDKKYIKIIKHLYKNLQKKDELKNEFDKTSNRILLYSLGITSFASFIMLSFAKSGIEWIILHSILGLLFGAFIPKLFFIGCRIKTFNNLISKKLSKHNLLNLYGRDYDFNIFLFKILEEIIKSTEKEHLKHYIKEITHIINSIPDKSKQNDIKMQFIEKMQIDIDSQLINLTDHKKEEENVIKIDCKNVIKIDCKSIVVNS